MFDTLLFFLFSCGVLYATFRVVMQFLSRRRSGEVNVAQLEERLTRIEQTVESTAIEVERITEGNRFVGKLLGERGIEAHLPRPASAPQRVVTPH
jgi:hypothetical protein